MKKVNFEKLYRNWPVHNIISRPASEIVYQVVRHFSEYRAVLWSEAIHNFSLPIEFEDM